jgi:hypothetical protein
MFQAATAAEISPLRLGFTGTLKIIRRAIADFQDTNSEQLPFFLPHLPTLPTLPSSLSLFVWDKLESMA